MTDIRNARNLDRADSISRLFWDNFMKSEPTFIMRDVIAIELEKAEERARTQTLQSIAQGLVRRYRDDPVATAALCDKELDCSGELLGLLREAAVP